jgi:hypothetical protein
MRSLTHRLAIASFGGIAALAVSVIPASVGSAATAAVAPSSTAGVATATLPNVTISAKTGKPAAFHPTAETVAPVAYTKCDATTAVLTVTNKTTATQTMLRKGKTFAAIPANEVWDVCAEGPAGAKGVFTLKGAKSKLTLTLS